MWIIELLWTSSTDLPLPKLLKIIYSILQIQVWLGLRRFNLRPPIYARFTFAPLMDHDWKGWWVMTLPNFLDTDGPDIVIKLILND
jgi:hypothetical protein